MKAKTGRQTDSERASERVRERKKERNSKRSASDKSNYISTAVKRQFNTFNAMICVYPKYIHADNCQIGIITHKIIIIKQKKKNTQNWTEQVGECVRTQCKNPEKRNSHSIDQRRIKYKQDAVQ